MLQGVAPGHWKAVVHAIPRNNVRCIGRSVAWWRQIASGCILNDAIGSILWLLVLALQMQEHALGCEHFLRPCPQPQKQHKGHVAHLASHHLCKQQPPETAASSSAVTTTALTLIASLMHWQMY